MLRYFSKYRKKPKWRAGDWVEIRSREDILATLDDQGTLDALPFMPEMLPHCGTRFQIVKAAHKTCDPTGQTNLRRMKDAVHLETRCDGSAHDGCQAGCRFFWKTDWLKPLGQPAAEPRRTGAGCTADTLHHAIRNEVVDETGSYTRYRCQTTEINAASTKLSSLEPTQYIRDLASRNITFTELTKFLPLSMLKNLKAVLDERILPTTRRLLGRTGPGDTRKSSPSPRFNLQPGEKVRILSRGEIDATLGKGNKNLGLTFDADMRQHCGETHTVMKRVERLIDERTGRMLTLSRDCLILDGVICTGLDCRTRMFCTRGAYMFWREAWVKRIGTVRKTVKQKEKEAA